MRLGERIDLVMKEQGKKQADISRATGIGSGQISYIVTGRTRDPAISYIVKIAEALNVSLDFLAGRDMKKIHYSDEFKQRVFDAMDKMTDAGKHNVAENADFQLAKNPIKDSGLSDTHRGGAQSVQDNPISKAVGA